MRAYKWTDAKMRAFYDGHQFHYGWNTQEGECNGQVCVPGGFHLVLSSNPNDLALPADSQNPAPSGERLMCWEAYYRQRDVLGRSPHKVRVRAFKLLRKRPAREVLASELLDWIPWQTTNQAAWQSADVDLGNATSSGVSFTVTFTTT